MAYSEVQDVDADVGALVIERFQRYLGTTEDLPLEGALIVDLGIDSIVLVTILMDISVQFNLDLGIARVKLGDVQTLSDIISVVNSLRDGEVATGDAPPRAESSVVDTELPRGADLGRDGNIGR